MIRDRGGSDWLRSCNTVVLTPHTCGAFGRLIVGEQNIDRATPTDCCEGQIGLRIRSPSVIMNVISRIPFHLSPKGASWCPPNIKAGLRHCASPKVGLKFIWPIVSLQQQAWAVKPCGR